jgi:hypothetical protein
MTQNSEIVLDLADAFSKRSKSSNQMWLALVVAATLVIFPNEDPGRNGVITLPFSLGSVDRTTYAFVGFMILTILIIAYCQAHAGAQNANRLAHALIDKLESPRMARTFYDIFVVSNFSRAAPLAALLPSQLRLRVPGVITAAYYVLLKMLALAVLFGIPSVALLTAYRRLVDTASNASWLRFFSIFALSVTCIAILQVVCVELHYIICRARDYAKGALP